METQLGAAVNDAAKPLKINGAWAHLLTDWLDQRGLLAPLLRSQLDSLSPSERLPMARWRQLLAAAAALAPNEPALGLEIGALIQPRHVGLLGYLVLGCQTLGEALRAYQRYEGLFYGERLATVVLDAGRVRIGWSSTASNGELADSISLAGLVHFMRQLVVDAVSPVVMGFVFAGDVKKQRAFEAFFDCPVTFNSPQTFIEMPLSFLTLPLRHGHKAWQQLLQHQASALQQGQQTLGSFERNLQQMLVHLLPKGQAGLAALARALRLSPRTLQRHLAKRNLSWQQLLDDTRQSLARAYLRDKQLGLTDIALLLGYAEQSAFTRACKRWTGCTPRQLRQQLSGSSMG